MDHKQIMKIAAGTKPKMETLNKHSTKAHDIENYVPLEGVPEIPGIKLHDYQVYARDYILRNMRCGLFLDMGLGKTLITLSALYALNPQYPVLVVAPVNIARTAWPNEIQKWKLPFEVTSFIYNENDRKLMKKKRLERYAAVDPNKPGIYLTSISSVKDAVEYFGSRWPFKMLILDESQSFKNPTGQRFLSLKSISHLVDRTVLLSGTPAPNGLMDLWSQAYLMDGGQRLGYNITQYRESYFTPISNDNGIPIMYKPRPWAGDIINEKMSSLAISIENANIKLPEVTVNDIAVEMEPKERKLYETMKKEFVLPLIEVTEDSEYTKEELIAANKAVLQSKLQQLASGAIYIDEDKNYEVVHRKKLEALVQIIQNTNSPVLVAYNFQSDLAEIQNILKENKIKAYKFDGSKVMESQWNNNLLDVMLIHPASAGHGMNFQDGDGHTLVWYSIPWNLEHYMQTNKRLHRQGQQNNVMIHRLITTKTVDEQISQKLVVKEMVQEALLSVISANL